MEICAFVESLNHVCCRYRLAAFVDGLHSAGHRLTIQPIPQSWWHRITLGAEFRNFDVAILQRRLFPAPLFHLLRGRVKKLIFDFDDAVFLRDSYSPKGPISRQRQYRFDAVVREADAVVAGNAWLAERAWSAGARQVVVIPTCVSHHDYPLADHGIRTRPQLAWIGSHSTQQGLSAIHETWNAVARRCPGAVLHVICDQPINLGDMPTQFVPWNSANEARYLADCDIGVSWIPDDDWSRGKCGLKVLQYMAAGLPVVANPVGVHPDMIEHGVNGFLASTADEWVDAVTKLAVDPGLRSKMGQAGRQRVEHFYSVPVGVDRWRSLIHDVCNAADPKRKDPAAAKPAEQPGVTWYLPSHLQALVGNGRPIDIDEWWRDGSAVRVKQAPHRTVWRVRRGGLDFFLKEYRAVGLRGRLRELLRSVKAKCEHDRAAELIARGVPTHPPLGWGVAGPSLAPTASYLLTATLDGARPLQEYLEVEFVSLPRLERVRCRQALARSLGAFFSRLHAAGVAHADPHPGNLLVRWAGDDPEFFLIDLHTVKLGPPLTWPQRVSNLCVLNRYFILRCDRADRRRFWRAYEATSAGAVPTDQKAATRQLERETDRSNRRLWAARDRRCRETNRYFCPVAQGPIRGFAVRDLDDAALKNLLTDLDAPFRQPPRPLLKDSLGSSVAEIEMPVNGAVTAVILKRFNVTAARDPFLALLRPTAALRSWVAGHGLIERRLPTPRPLAVVHRYRAGLPAEGYLLTVKVPDALELHAFTNTLDSLPAGQCTKILRVRVETLARLIRTLHARRLAHRDLKAANVLTAAESHDVRCWLIDLVGLRMVGHLSRKTRVKNLARLHASFHDHPLISRTEKLRFLRTYMNWGLRGKDGWQRWWREIGQATQAKLARNARQGRAVA